MAQPGSAFAVNLSWVGVFMQGVWTRDGRQLFLAREMLSFEISEAFEMTACATTIPRLNGMLPRTHAWSLQTDMDMEMLCDIQAQMPLPCCHLFPKNLKSVRNPIAHYDTNTLL